MRNFFFGRRITVLLFLSLHLIYLQAQPGPYNKKILQQEYNLLPAHSRDTQYYTMESRLSEFAPDGTISGADVYRLYLRCVPDKAGLKGDKYTCLKFTVQLNNSPELPIPSLTGWSYFFTLAANGRDEKGQMFGIDQSKFEELSDKNGKTLPVENAYHVYNAFIDFHSMSVFAEKTDSGKGVQDLRRIGQEIIHGASFSQPSVSMGSQVGDGSYFKNGQIRLAFKGLSIVNRRTCALLGYDSGESSFYMVTKPMPNMEVKTKGASHYQGDIYKDLSSGWLQKATLHELVVSETSVPGMANKINSVIERNIVIANIDKNIAKTGSDREEH